MPCYYMNHNCDGFFSHPFCSLCRFLILDSCFFGMFTKRHIVSFANRICTQQHQQSPKQSFFTSRIFQFSISIWTSCHLPIQNKIALSKHVIQNRSLQKREKTHIAHLTKLTKTHFNCLKSYRTHIRIYVSRASHVDVCMWAYAVRIRNMFRLEVNRAKVLTFNTSPNRHPFTIPSA